MKPIRQNSLKTAAAEALDGLVVVTAGMPVTCEVFSSQARRDGTIAGNQSEWSNENEHEKTALAGNAAEAAG